MSVQFVATGVALAVVFQRPRSFPFHSIHHPIQRLRLPASSAKTRSHPPFAKDFHALPPRLSREVFLSFRRHRRHLVSFPHARHTDHYYFSISHLYYAPIVISPWVVAVFCQTHIINHLSSFWPVIDSSDVIWLGQSFLFSASSACPTFATLRML